MLFRMGRQAGSELNFIFGFFGQKFLPLCTAAKGHKQKIHVHLIAGSTTELLVSPRGSTPGEPPGQKT